MVYYYAVWAGEYAFEYTGRYSSIAYYTCTECTVGSYYAVTRSKKSNQSSHVLDHRIDGPARVPALLLKQCN